MRQWVSKKLSTGLAPKTVHYMKGTLRTALNQAVEDGWWRATSQRRCGRVRRSARSLIRLDVSETRRFLRAIRGDRHEVPYLVALLGLRQGEVIGLRRRDLDLSAGRLEVRQALQRVRRRYELVDPKTEGSRRAVKLPPTLVLKLREHRARQAAERLLAERWSDEWGLVFTTPSGAPLNARVLLTAFQRKLSEAGLPKVRFHDYADLRVMPTSGPRALRLPLGDGLRALVRSA